MWRDPSNGESSLCAPPLRGEEEEEEEEEGKEGAGFPAPLAASKGAIFL